MTPIFFAYTKSFWLGVVPALIAACDLILALADDTTIGPIASLIASLFGADPAQVETIMRAVASLAAIVVAHQRRGNNRPYTMNPRAK